VAFIDSVIHSCHWLLTNSMTATGTAAGPNRSQDNDDMQLKWKTFKHLTNPRPKVPKMIK